MCAWPMSNSMPAAGLLEPADQVADRERVVADARREG